jgi:hypothetical protein
MTILQEQSDNKHNSTMNFWILLDGVRKERISLSSTTGLYICEAEGQPPPQFAWLLLHNNGTREVVSSHAQLNVTQFREQDNVTLEFRCLSSNVVNGQRYTTAVDTTVFIIGRLVILT